MTARFVDLERLRYAVIRRVTDRLASRIGVDAVAEIVGREVVFRVNMDILAQQTDEVSVEAVAKYPADWWEAVRERFAPAWALRRWPVRFAHKRATAKAKIYRGFPDLAAPAHAGRVVRFWVDESPYGGVL